MVTQQLILDSLCVVFLPFIYVMFLDSENVFEELSTYVKLFKNLLNRLHPWLYHADKKTKERNLLLIQAALLLYKPATLTKTITKLYSNSFTAFKSINKEVFRDIEDLSESYDDDGDIECSSCNYERDTCKCQELLEEFTALNYNFSELGLTEHFANPAIVSVVHHQLTDFIETNCKGEFLEPWLYRVSEWMKKALIAWLNFALSNASTGRLRSNTYLTVDEWQPRLEYFAYKAFAELRISELFEIIVEYPDSIPAINDLKECMLKTETRELLTTSLRKSFENRLLHPAVNTDDILTQYVSAIRTLRELDSTGVILENVCAPLREYLRNREDTIKCIITCLTDQETGPDLAEELFGPDMDVEGVKGAESDSDGEDWVPDPIDAKTDLSSKSQRTADIINILVNIYGSQDMFVSQYRVLLADRILTNFSYDVTNERRYLELLKRRFGENHLHFCDIMLKDIQDSHRINRLIKDEAEKKKEKEPNEKEDEKDEIEFNAFILSSAFWPSLAEDTVEPPKEIKDLMDDYTSIYKQSKGMRTLEWFDNLGSVELEIELEDGARTFNATPAQATLILKFQEKEEWDLSELSTEMNITKTSLRSRIAFWVGQGVIIEKQNDVYTAVQSFLSRTHEASIYESDDEMATASSQNQKDEELQVYWSYVVGMLTNLGSLPLERIHSMLRMFAVHGNASSQCSEDEVKAFLQNKVNDGELLYVGGMYKLPKAT